MAVTLHDVAAKAGVGYGTACRALSGRGSVSARARERVAAAAVALGFRANRVASLLASTRGRAGSGLSFVKLGSNLRANDEFLDACAGAGIHGAVHRFADFDNPRAMLDTLYARGVDGLAITFGPDCPWPEAALRNLDWSRFSVVKLGRPYPALPFHIVRHDAFDYMRLTLRGVRTAGGRNVAVLLPASGSEEDDQARVAAALWADWAWRSEGRRFHVRFWNTRDPRQPDAATLAWLRDIEPDVIVSLVWVVWYPLTEAGWRFPRDAGFAAVLAPDVRQRSADLSTIAGCTMRMDAMMQTAVAKLGEMVARSERGFASTPGEFVVEPVWSDGETLRPGPGTGAVGSPPRS